MAIVVEHDKRREEILKNSLELFCRDGYEAVTFQKIADACGITRTTLYIYFKNKREIFSGTIKQLTTHLQESIIAIIRDRSLNAEKTLRKILEYIADECVENKALFAVLLTYLIQLQKSGDDIQAIVRRKIIKMEHILNMILIQGQKNGEFKSIPIRDANQLLYSLIESAIFEISVLAKQDVSEVKSSMNLAIDGILA